MEIDGIEYKKISPDEILEKIRKDFSNPDLIFCATKGDDILIVDESTKEIYRRLNINY